MYSVGFTKQKLKYTIDSKRNHKIYFILEYTNWYIMGKQFKSITLDSWSIGGC